MHELAGIATIGAGRLGTALSAALRDAGLTVEGPLRRGEAPSAQATLVLLCVPDSAIAEAADAIAPGPLVGHCSGATTPEPIAAAEELATRLGMAPVEVADADRATVENWARDGRAALTGPIARGDTTTVERHRAALGGRAPELLPLYDTLAAATC